MIVPLQLLKKSFGMCGDVTDILGSWKWFTVLFTLIRRMSNNTINNHNTST
jgi:hypothetical protein